MPELIAKQSVYLFTLEFTLEEIRQLIADKLNVNVKHIAIEPLLKDVSSDASRFAKYELTSVQVTVDLKQ